MAELTISSQESENPARWHWFLALGAVLLGLGTASIGFATLLEVTSLLVFGPMLLASSIIQLVTALCIAVDFICHGFCWSALALVERKPFQESLT